MLIFALAWLPIALFIRMLFALGAFLPASQDLKLHEYNDGVRVLARVAMPAAVLSAVYIAVSLVLLAIQQERLTALEIFRVAMFAAAGDSQPLSEGKSAKSNIRNMFRPLQRTSSRKTLWVTGKAPGFRRL